MSSRASLPAALLLAVVVGLAALWFLSKPSRSTGGSTGPQAGPRGSDSHRRTAKDDSGREWELLVWPGAGREGSAGAARQESVESDLSRPLVGTVVARKRGQGQGQVSLVLTVETAGGRRVRSVSVAGRQPPEPTFTITDESGQRVHSGKFEYG